MNPQLKGHYLAHDPRLRNALIAYDQVYELLQQIQEDPEMVLECTDERAHDMAERLVKYWRQQMMAEIRELMHYPPGFVFSKYKPENSIPWTLLQLRVDRNISETLLDSIDFPS